MEKCGRGIHKRRKKGARRQFIRPKNYERKHQQQNKENHEIQQQQAVDSHTSVSMFDQIKESRNSLPDHWLAFPGDDDIQWSRIEMKENGFRQMNPSVQLKRDLTWNVTIHGKQVPDTCKLLSVFPSIIPSIAVMSNVITCVQHAILCPGNPDKKFVSLCEQRGGTMKKGETTIAQVDNTPVVGTDGQEYLCSVRRVECDLLCLRSSRHPVRCKACQAYRSTLRSVVTRSSRTDGTQASSHTNYTHLTHAKKNLRMKNLQQSLKVVKQRSKRLEMRLKKIIEKEAVSLQSSDEESMSNLVKEMTPTVEGKHPENSAQRIFWDQQMAYNKLADKRQIRWHPLVLRFALNLKYLSTSAYQAVRRSGIIFLPSERTLNDYTHWTTPQSGLQFEYVEEFHSMLTEVLPSHQHQCALSMDEMKIKRGLVYNKHTGNLVGFVNTGDVNHDIERVVNGESEQSDSANLASQVFVIMARAVFKPSLSIPISHYFSANLKGEKIFPLVWEAVETLELFNIPVVSLTSDGAKPNRRFYRLCQMKENSDIPFKTSNPFSSSSVRDGKVYFFCDAPHLLKTARNCFSNSYAHSKSRRLMKGGQGISWKSIESLYLREAETTTPGVRVCHKLTRDHVWLTSYTRMRVYLAAQVMSESVASALDLLGNDNTKQTQMFIRMVDRFFDYLNVRSPMVHVLKRKESVAPYSKVTDERFKWLKQDFLQYLDEWETDIASIPGLKKKEQQKMCLSKETLLGLRITAKAFTELGPELLKVPGVKYVLSEVFSQDPLERYFSRQRHRGGSNDNPTAYQVPYNASILLQQQSVYKDLKTMNVEVDNQDSNLQTVSQPLRKRPRHK